MVRKMLVHTRLQEIRVRTRVRCKFLSYFYCKKTLAKFVLTGLNPYLGGLDFQTHHSRAQRC